MRGPSMYHAGFRRGNAATPRWTVPGGPFCGVWLQAASGVMLAARLPIG